MGRMLSAKLRELSGPDDEDGQQISHWCPACEHRHYINVTKPNHCGAIWSFDGNAESPTFTPSVNINHGECHYNITAGKIIFHADCKHKLAGQTVDLPDLKGY